MAIIPVGQEPERIKKRLDVLFPKLDDAYPDKVIRGLQKNHKKWSETVRELYQLLGYPDNTSFFEAYGYTVERSTGGRPQTVDAEAIIQELKHRYPEGSGFVKLQDLIAANPDLAGSFKTMTNKSQAILGMPFGKYLKEQGILNGISTTERKKTVHKLYLAKVQFPGTEKELYYEVKSVGVKDFDYVEAPYGRYNLPVNGTVQQVVQYFEDELPELEYTPKKLLRTKLSYKEIQQNLSRSLMTIKADTSANQLIENQKAAPFNPENLPICSADNHFIPWACFKGFAPEVLHALNSLIEFDNQTYSLDDYITEENGLAKVYVFGNDVKRVLAEYPNLKAVMFAETKTNNVDLFYSRSGYPGITDSYEVGYYDDNNRWTLKYSPIAADTIKISAAGHPDIKYTFKYDDDWKSINYIFTDGDCEKQLGGEI